MPLPRQCCCCIDLDLGSHILNAISIIGHTSVLVDTLLDFDKADYADEDAGEVMHVTIVAWCLVGICISTLLTLGVALVSDFWLGDDWDDVDPKWRPLLIRLVWDRCIALLSTITFLIH